MFDKIKPGSIESIILQLCDIYREFYGCEPHQINNGQCWEFADELKRFFPDGECKNNQEYREGTKYIWDHAFFLYNGLYYDSEAPQGVSDWRDLPCCKAFLK